MCSALNDQNDESIGFTLTDENCKPENPSKSLNCKECKEDFGDETELHSHLLNRHVKLPYILLPRVPSPGPPIKITLKTRNNNFEIISNTETTEVSNGEGRETRRRRGRRKHINYCEDYDFDDSSQNSEYNSEEGSAATGGEETSQDVPDSVKAVEKAADIAEEFGITPFEEDDDDKKKLHEYNEEGEEEGEEAHETESNASTMTPAPDETPDEVIEEIHNPEKPTVPKLRIVKSQFLFNKESDSQNFSRMVELKSGSDGQQSPAYPNQSPSHPEDRPVWNTPSLEDPLRLPEPDKDVGNLLQTLFNNNEASNNAIANIPSTETEYISLERLGERNKQLQVYNNNSVAATTLDSLGLPMQQLAQQVSRLQPGMHQQNVLINIQQFPSAPQQPPPQYGPPPMHHYPQAPPGQHPQMYHQPYHMAPPNAPNYPYYPPAYPQMPPQQPPQYRQPMAPPPGSQMQPPRMPMQPSQQQQQQLQPRQPMSQQQGQPRMMQQQQQNGPRMQQQNGPRMQQQARMTGPRGQQPPLPRGPSAPRQRAPMMRGPMPRGAMARGTTRPIAPRPAQPGQQQRPMMKRPVDQHHQQNTLLKRKRMDMLIPDKHDDADCQVISMQPPQNDGLPVIQNVQGADTGGGSSDPANVVHLTDSITLSVRHPSQSAPAPTAQKKSDAKAVANILATRGITVTAAAKPKDNGNGHSSSSNSPSPPPAVAINLNSAVSIIPSAKTKTPAPSNKTLTVDLTDDSDVPSPPSPSASAASHQSKSSNQQQQQQQSQRGGGVLQYRCDLCAAQYPTSIGLTKHRQSYHKVISPSEIGIPLIDLKQPSVLAKLSSLGIYNYIPLPGTQPDAMLGLPVVSVNAARSPSVCNLAGLGATSILSLGPVRSVPNVNNRQPHQ